MLKSVALISLLLIGTTQTFAFAQANPTLSEIKKQQEELLKNTQSDSLNQQRLDELEVEHAAEESQVSGGITFLLKGISITGNNVLTKQDVSPLIEPLINTQITGDGLKTLAAKLTLVLSGKGYKSSRAFVPAQEIKNGVVEIRVEEDLLASIHVLGEDSFKYNEALFFQYFSDLKGKIIHTPTLIERLKYLNFLPGTRITPTLKKLEYGQSALVLVLTPVQDTTAIAINNNASKYQGEFRTMFSTMITNPTGRSDTLSLFAAINPEYPKYFSSIVGNYSLPFGEKGGKVLLNYSHLDYQIDPDALGQSLFLYTGSSETVSLEFEKPFLLDYGTNSWSVGVERRQANAQTTNNFVDPLVGGQTGYAWVDQKETIYGLNFAAQFVLSDLWLDDALPAQNLIKVKLTKVLEGFMDGLTQEDIDFKQINENNGIIPVTGPVGDTRQATANFWKLYVNYMRRQALPWQLFMNFQLNAEYANFDNIPSSYDYGGADSGTSGGDWSLSLLRTFSFEQYLDWVSIEAGFEQQVAYNVFIPVRTQPFGDEVSSCDNKQDLVAYESYQCEASSPFISVRAKSDNHILWLKYKSELAPFGLTEDKATLSYTYVF